MKENKINIKENIGIAMIAPMVIIICAIIKWIVRSNIELDGYVKVCSLLYINYTQHFCDYLDIKHSVNELGLILQMISITVTLYMSMFSKVKRNGYIIFMNSAFIVELIIANMLFEPIAMADLAGYIVRIIIFCSLYIFSDYMNLITTTFGKVVFGAYIGASFGNIIEQNISGFVTDYLWLLPEYGKMITYNLEDWIIILCVISIFFKLFIEYFNIVKSLRQTVIDRNKKLVD